MAGAAHKRGDMHTVIVPETLDGGVIPALTAIFLAQNVTLGNVIISQSPKLVFVLSQRGRCAKFLSHRCENSSIPF